MLGDETACFSCGHPWSAAEDVCPVCGGAEYRGTTYSEELYDPDGLRCESCGDRWHPLRASAPRVCPSCGSGAVVDHYPEIPSLDDEPGLMLVLAVEGQIPRTEGGAILFREMLAWLRFHGVRDRGEILMWEWFFSAIGAIRSRIVEELTAVPPPSGGNAEPEE